MYSTSKKIFEALNGNAALMAIIDKVSPIITSQESAKKFVNYTLQEEGPYSKEGKYDYTLIIHSWASTYDDTLIIADAVKTALLIDEPNIEFYYKGSRPQFSEEGIYYTESIYTFKN